MESAEARYLSDVPVVADVHIAESWAQKGRRGAGMMRKGLVAHATGGCDSSCSVIAWSPCRQLALKTKFAPFQGQSHPLASASVRLQALNFALQRRQPILEHREPFEPVEAFLSERVAAGARKAEQCGGAGRHAKASCDGYGHSSPGTVRRPVEGRSLRWS